MPIQILLATIIAAQKRLETQKKIETKFIKYAQSSQVEDDDDSSVSYASSYSVILDSWLLR